MVAIVIEPSLGRSSRIEEVEPWRDDQNPASWSSVTTLQLPLFLDASSAERVVDGMTLWKSWELRRKDNFFGRCLDERKAVIGASDVDEKPPNPVGTEEERRFLWQVGRRLKKPLTRERKNQPPKSMKNLLIQWETEEENRQVDR